MRFSIQLLAVIAALSTATIVRAQEWPRFHVGVAVGHSDNFALDWSASGLPERFWGNESAELGKAKKVVAGFRPLRVVGVEVEFVNFGDDSRAAASGMSWGGGQIDIIRERSSWMKISAEAAVLSAVLFIPEPLPLIDIYGKVGVANLEESFTASATTVGCVPISQCLSTIDSNVHRRESGAYIGIGARFQIVPAVSVRVEYETIDRDVGDNPTLVSVGIAWQH